MKKETVLEVIYAIVGKIEPVADSAIDSDRLDNVQLLISVVDNIHTDLLDIARMHKKSPYASQKRVAIECEEFINSLKDVEL